MKDFKEYRDKRINEWKKQKQERLELRRCMFIYVDFGIFSNVAPVDFYMTFKCPQISTQMRLTPTIRTTKKKLLNFSLKKKQLSLGERSYAVCIVSGNFKFPCLKISILFL